jgi:hypothetical protein
MSDKIELSTADMLEIAASGGNGVEYVDVPALMEKAAAELREAADEIVRLRESEREWMAVSAGHIEEAATARAERDRLRDALRKIDSHIFNDNGDVTFSPLQIKAIVRAALKGDTQ